MNMFCLRSLQPLVITYLERSDLLALLCVVFLCFVTFSYGVLCQVCCYLIVFIPDICPILYYGHKVYHRTRISNVVFCFSLKFMYLIQKLMT